MLNSRRLFLGLGSALGLKKALGFQEFPWRDASLGRASKSVGHHLRAEGELAGWPTPQEFMSEDQKSAVARRTRTQDVTSAVLRMFATGAREFYFPPGDYPISIDEGTALVRFVKRSGCEVVGKDAVLYDPHVYRDGSISAIFELEGCSQFRIAGLDYEGVPIVNPADRTYGVGYRGATFVNLKSGCSDVEISANLRHLRYGVRSGDYVRPEFGGNRKIRTSLRTYRCGYPIAHYLAEQVNAELYAESSHRTAYLAGVTDFDVVAEFKDENIAPIQVLLTDALEAPGKSRGCSSGRVVARDMGSTQFVQNSWCAGIALSRVDPGTTFEDLDIQVQVVGTDQVATTMGAFVIVSTANVYQPSYQHNWEPSITLQRIRISGVVDRGSQTVPGNSAADLYINTVDSPGHSATVLDLDFSQLKIIPGRSLYRPVFCMVPGLSDSAAETEKKCTLGR